MAEQRRPDPSSRPDPYELAVARAAEEPEPEEADGAPLPRLGAGPFRVGPLGLALGFLFLVLVAAFVRLGGEQPVELDPSCTTPAVALSDDAVPQGGLVRWAAVGPDGAAVALRVGDQEVPGGVLRDCRYDGRFGVQVPPGRVPVELLVDGEPAGTAELVVEEPARGAG